MNQNINQKKETLDIPSVQMESNSDRLQETLTTQSEKVSELVGKRTQEDITNTTVPTNTQEKKLPQISFFDRINQLIFSHKEQTEIPSTRKAQEKYLKQALDQERKRLLKKIHEIENHRNFSPSTLEKTIHQLREIQKLMSNIVHMATTQVKELYKKYVLKSEN